MNASLDIYKIRLSFSHFFCLLRYNLATVFWWSSVLMSRFKVISFWTTICFTWQSPTRWFSRHLHHDHQYSDSHCMPMTNQPESQSLLSDIEITKILILHRDGHTEWDIAKIIHRSKGAIEHTLQTYNFDTFVGHKLRPLRPRKTTKHEDRYLLHAAK